MLIRIIFTLSVIFGLIMIIKGENDKLSSECDKKNGKWLERERVCMKKEFFINDDK